MSHEQPETSVDHARVDAVKADRSLVWHYTDGTGLLSILRSHTLWATSSAFLNDRQEVKLGAQRLIERVVELADDHAHHKTLFAELAEEVATQASTGRGPQPEHFYILSASALWDSLAMWRLYGGVQESYAIGIDSTAPLSVYANGVDELAQGVFLHSQQWQPVRYDDAEQQELIDAVLLDLPSDLERFEPARDQRDAGRPVELDDDQLELAARYRDALQAALSLVKHDGFRDEREVRFNVTLSGHPSDPASLEQEAQMVSFRSTPYGIAPYLRMTGSPDGAAFSPTLRPLPIRAVAISPSPNGDEATRSVETLLHRHGYDDVPVLRSTIPFRG